jgi:tRNA A37 threonylcarbamoyladenosine modification protein TsaB
MAIAVQELIDKLNAYGEKVTFLGDGVPVYAKQLEEGLTVPYSFAPAHVNRQSASAVGTLGMKYFAEGKTETAREHQPDYLRVSQAERERAEKNANLS